MRSVLALILFLVLCAPALAAAEELPPEVDLAAVVQIAKRSDGVRQRAIAARARAARAGLVEASVYPNPSLSYAFTGPLRGPNTIDGAQHWVGIDQPLLLAGQRGARRRAAEGRIRAADARAAADLVGLVREARHLYVDLLLAQETLRIQESSLKALERVRGIVETRSALGGSSRYDAVRLDVEESALAAELERGRAQVDDAGSRLGVLLGRPGWSPRARGKLDPTGVSVPFGQAVKLAARSNAELRAAQREASAAATEAEAASREAWPVPSLGVGALMTTDPRSVAGVVGVSIPFPVFDRAQGTRARARAELAAVDAEQRALLAVTTAEAERAAKQLAMKRASLGRLEQSALTRLPTLARMAEDAYREGAGGVVALLDASTAERDLRLARASLAAEVLHAEIDVLAATGAILETARP
jgi:outer membrane protein, heavy metal efflux system